MMEEGKDMTTVNRSFIMSVFNDNDQAQQAMNDLRLAGFGEDQIRREMQNGVPMGAQPVGEEGSGTGTVVKSLGLGGGIGALLGAGTGFALRQVNPSIANQPLWETLLEGAGTGTALGSLVGLFVGKKVSQQQMGANADEVAGVVILVEDDHRPQEVLDILRRNGAAQIQTGMRPGSTTQQSAPARALNSQATTVRQTTRPPAARPAQGTGQVSAPASTATAAARPTPSLVVAAFPNQTQAQKAIDALLGAGFHNEQIRYSEHGSAGGGILNHLLSLGVPQQEAYAYEREFEMGHTVVTVRTLDRQQEATNVLKSQEAYNIKLLSSQPTTSAATVANAATSPSSQATAASSEATENLRLREEQLRINKQQVQTGEVDVNRELVTEEKTISVPVTHEEVVIEYHPTEGSTHQPIQEGQTIRIPVSEEQVHVTKQTVQTDEVTIDKRQVQDVQQITEPVMHEELRVERKGDVEVVDNTSANPSNQEG